MYNPLGDLCSSPPQVLSPLLTADAIDLLTNCLTSRENELWQILGDAWCVPKHMWKFAVPPYQPVFRWARKQWLGLRWDREVMKTCDINFH